MKKINLKVNGVSRQFVVGSDRVLLDLLREDLRLIGAKQSCDRKGQCGACTVIVNGKAVRSCLTKVIDLEGAEVISVEGLGTPDNPHLIQEAFVLSGAIQCGYCTPGMILAAKALLDKNPDPDTEEIKKALARNLCRCTGYVKIIEAVKLAGRFLRGETTPEQVRPDPRQRDDRGVASTSLGHAQGLRGGRVYSRYQTPECDRSGCGAQYRAPCDHQIHRYQGGRKNAWSDRRHDGQGYQGDQPA